MWLYNISLQLFASCQLCQFPWRPWELNRRTASRATSWTSPVLYSVFTTVANVESECCSEVCFQVVSSIRPHSSNVTSGGGKWWSMMEQWSDLEELGGSWGTPVWVINKGQLPGVLPNQSWFGIWPRKVKLCWSKTKTPSASVAKLSERSPS